jgi:hypothetical protein
MRHSNEGHNYSDAGLTIGRPDVDSGFEDHRRGLSGIGLDGVWTRGDLSKTPLVRATGPIAILSGADVNAPPGAVAVDERAV